MTMVVEHYRCGLYVLVLALTNLTLLRRLVGLNTVLMV